MTSAERALLVYLARHIAEQGSALAAEFGGIKNETEEEIAKLLASVEREEIAPA